MAKSRRPKSRIVVDVTERGSTIVSFGVLNRDAARIAHTIKLGKRAKDAAALNRSIEAAARRALPPDQADQQERLVAMVREIQEIGFRGLRKRENGEKGRSEISRRKADEDQILLKIEKAIRKAHDGLSDFAIARLVRLQASRRPTPIEFPSDDAARKRIKRAKERGAR